MTAPTVLAATVEGGLSSEFRPYGYYNEVNPDRLQAYFRQSVDAAARRPGVRTWNLNRSGRWTGLAQLEPLEWDSRMLGRQAARLNWLLAPGDYPASLKRKQELLDWAIEEACRQGIEYLVARPAAGDLSSIHALESRGFEMLDAILTFARSPREAAAPSGRVRLGRSEDVAALRRISESSFRYDRYHADPTIPSAVADRLHGEWIASSVQGFADAVLVAEADSNGAPIGFCTVKADRQSGPLLGISIATIVLVATAPEARGAGVGRLLTRAALEWCREQAVDRVEVGTQVRNVAACRLYASAGFEFVHASVSMRLALAGPQSGRKQ